MHPLARQLLLAALAVAAVIAGVLLSRMMAGAGAEPRAATDHPPRPLRDFALVDHRGEDFTPADLEGDWHVLFFGFTHCPDVCPLTLSLLANALETPTGTAPLADVVLVSVDPERDTPARLARYVAGFDERFTGVTGTPEAIADFAMDVGVAYGRTPVDERGNYNVDHSAAVFVVNPAGQLTAVFTPPLTATDVRADLELLRRRWHRS